MRSWPILLALTLWLLTANPVSAHQRIAPLLGIVSTHINTHIEPQNANLLRSEGSGALSSTAHPAINQTMLYTQALGTFPLVIVPLVDSTWDVSHLGTSDVGWLDYTGWPTYPNNNTVLAAHYTWEGEPGPFWELPNVRTGDVIVLAGPDGVYLFTVQRVFYVNVSDVGVTYSIPGQETLTLITCSALGTSRLVVQAVEE